jgi:hypothetical protein
MVERRGLASGEKRENTKISRIKIFLQNPPRLFLLLLLLLLLQRRC